MSYHIKYRKSLLLLLHEMSKNKAENAITKYLVLLYLSKNSLRCNKCSKGVKIPNAFTSCYRLGFKLCDYSKRSDPKHCER
jgi:hypothetical protein